MASKTLCAFLLVGALSVPCAHAAGVNLRWDACFGDGGVPNKNFACNTNTGTNSLAASFVLAAAVQQAVGIQAGVDVASAASPLPSWWQFRNAGSCRLNSLASNTALSIAAVSCIDWYQGSAASGIGS